MKTYEDRRKKKATTHAKAIQRNLVLKAIILAYSHFLLLVTALAIWGD